ncbi:MAG: IS110 family transposase [Thermoplasmata archaeon]
MEIDTYVGFDVSKNSIVATAVDPLGHPLRQEKLGTTDEEIQQFLRDLPGAKQVVLEACNVWEHIYDAAASTGAEVLLANPFQVKLVSKTTLKTDRVDSEKLAKLARLRAIPEAYAPTLETRALRRLVRERVFYTREWASVANHTYAILLQKGIPFRPAILRRRTLRSEVEDPCIPEIARGIESLTRIEETTRALDGTIREAFEASEEAQLLATIPGVGKFTAIVLVAFLCPIERFPSLDSVVKYCGLCPSVHQSGDKSYHGPLVWDSNTLLKWVLIEGQWNVRRHEKKGDVSRVGHRVARRKAASDGAVPAARKLVRIAVAILRRHTPYEPRTPESSSRLSFNAES